MRPASAGRGFVRRRSEAPARILEAAIATIEEGGESAVRVHDLAAACGVTGPILYRAFGSREGLVVAAQTERYRRTAIADVDALSNEIDRCASCDELRTVLSRHVAHILSPERSRDRRVRANIVGSSITRPALAAEIVAIDRRTVGLVGAALDRARSRSLVRSDVDTLALAAWVVGQATGRIHVDLAPSDIDAAAWDDIARTAVLSMAVND